MWRVKAAYFVTEAMDMLDAAHSVGACCQSDFPPGERSGERVGQIGPAIVPTAKAAKGHAHALVLHSLRSRARRKGLDKHALLFASSINFRSIVDITVPS